MDVPVVVTVEAGLSFLGLGVRPPTPTWGTILNDGFAVIRDTPWLVIAGGVPLILDTLGFTFLGEALRDTFDPRLRRDALRWRPLLEIRDLSVDFVTPRGPVHALRDVRPRGAARRRSSASSARAAAASPRSLGGRCALLPGNAAVARRRDPLRRARPAETAASASSASCAAGGIADGLPGPDDLAEPGAHDRPQMIDIQYRRARSGARRSARGAIAHAAARSASPIPSSRIDQYPHQFSRRHAPARSRIAMALLADPAC